jgi:O-antigen/teichoic acid export membrane protein
MGESTQAGVTRSIALFGATIVYGLGDAANRSLAALVLIPLYTRFLSPEDYGILTTLAPLAWLTSTICGMSMSGSLVRFYHDSSDEAQRKRLCGTVTLFVLAIPLVIVALLSVAGRRPFEHYFPQVPFAPYGLLTLWFAYFVIVPELLLALWRAQEKPLPYVLFSCAGFVVTASAIAVAVAKMQMGLLGKMVAELSVAIALSIVALALLRRRLTWRVDSGLLRSVLLFGLPLVPHNVTRWVLNYVSRPILLSKAGAYEAGLFGLGSQLGGLLLIMVASADKALTPWFYRTAGEPDAPRVLGRTATHFFIAISSVTLVICVFGREIIQILGTPEYQDAHRIVPLIALGALFVAAYYFPIKGLMLLKRTVVVPLLTATAGTVTIGVNLLLVPKLGMIGAATGTVAGQIILFTLTFAVSQRLYTIHYEYAKLAKVLIACVGLYAASLFVPDANLLISIGMKLLIVVTLPFWLLTLGAVNREELRSVVRAVVRTIARRRGSS